MTELYQPLVYYFFLFYFLYKSKKKTTYLIFIKNTLGMKKKKGRERFVVNPNVIKLMDDFRVRFFKEVENYFKPLPRVL